jgi:hypothetical protein
MIVNVHEGSVIPSMGVRRPIRLLVAVGVLLSAQSAQADGAVVEKPLGTTDGHAP